LFKSELMLACKQKISKGEMYRRLTRLLFSHNVFKTRLSSIFTIKVCILTHFTLLMYWVHMNKAVLNSFIQVRDQLDMLFLEQRVVRISHVLVL